MGKKYNSYVQFSCLPSKARAKYLQDIFIKKGIDVEINGKYDKATKKAVMTVQKEHDLAPNGIVCPKTYAAILSLPNKVE